MSEKTQAQLLKEKLFYKKKNVFEERDDAAIEHAYAYAEGYKKYLDAAKTEREAVNAAIALAEAAGFAPYTLGGELKAGGKYYLNNRGKSLFLIKMGTESPECGVRINAAHIDSPRLDLKQHPLYEDNGFAYLKTHYYGGIRKYQWTTIPLALHGVVTKLSGETVDVVIGEDENDPIFCITDLLPHLAANQSQKPLGTAFEGEGLNLILGCRPYRDEEIDQKIKLNMMSILNEKYGIVESDFISAELTVTPAMRARDLGLDRALIAGYGHDDRVCAYPVITSILEDTGADHTVIGVLADKEEIGSCGVSGMRCRLLADLIDEIARETGTNANVIRANSMCLSADVSAGFDPLYPEVFEKRNSALLSCGVVMNKYTGARGKSGSNDASAEYVAKVRAIFEANDVIWQTAELGKVDAGGGGTVASDIANHNIDTVDLGVPVLSMHAPMEVISKADLYETHKAFCAFCK